MMHEIIHISALTNVDWTHSMIKFGNCTCNFKLCGSIQNVTKNLMI